MFQVQIKVNGLNGVRNMIVNLPVKTVHEVDLVEGEMMKFIQKSAKLRAPKFSGQLAESMQYTRIKEGNWKFWVDSPYGIYQELGFEGHFLPAGMPVKGGYRIGDWMHFKGMQGGGFIPRGIAHPFAGPALQAALTHLPRMLKTAIDKAIQESK